MLRLMEASSSSVVGTEGRATACPSGMWKPWSEEDLGGAEDKDAIEASTLVWDCNCKSVFSCHDEKSAKGTQQRRMATVMGLGRFAMADADLWIRSFQCECFSNYFY